MLSKAQGLGKKTAERIVVELKDKVLPKGTITSVTANKSTDADFSENIPEAGLDLGALRRCCLGFANSWLQSNRC